MFYTPKDAVYSRVSRRKFLELGGGAATALGVGSMTLGLGSTITRARVQAQSSDDAKWKQYAGSKLDLHVGEHAAVLRHPRQYQDLLRSRPASRSPF